MTPTELRAARKRLDLTQKGLAKALRMGTHGWQSISKWERDGGTVPGPVQVAVELLIAQGDRRMTDPGLATYITLLSIEKFIDLRKRMQLAVEALDDGRSQDARDILQTALDETDFGTMKEWKPGEEPF